MKTSAMKLLKKIFRGLLNGIGILALLLFLLAFTDVPYMAYHQLSLSDQQLEESPDAIIIMGGDGMPSPQGLIRLYYGNEMAKLYPEAKVVLAMPEAEEDSLKQLQLMAKELRLKGVSDNRLIFEPNGFNTRSQVLAISKILPKKSKLLVVTSPEHIYRTIRSFEKVGFQEVGSLPTFETPAEEENLRNKNKQKDKEIKNLSLRYNLWSYLQYEIKVLREYFAIAYYWAKGWI
ncbi:MAG: YdcF family protein [Vicingaceae bacterium]